MVARRPAPKPGNGMRMKGIILAGGSGTRLHAMTGGANKHLVPVLGRPMVHYPLSLLLASGIAETLVVSSPRDLPFFRELLGDGSRLGARFAYATQDEPRGLAHGLLVGEAFAAGQPVCLALGDNLIDAPSLPATIRGASALAGARVFVHRVPDPRRFAVAELDPEGKVLGLVEKPAQPRSDWAVPGLYLYDATVMRRARDLTPSARGELEITDLNLDYLREGALRASPFPEGALWMDLGTPESLRAAEGLLAARMASAGRRIGCLEEAAWRGGLLSDDALCALADDCDPDLRAHLRALPGRAGR